MNCRCGSQVTNKGGVIHVVFYSKQAQETQKAIELLKGLKWNEAYSLYAMFIPHGNCKCFSFPYNPSNREAEKFFVNLHHKVREYLRSLPEGNEQKTLAYLVKSLGLAKNAVFICRKRQERLLGAPFADIPERYESTSAGEKGT